MNCSCHKAELSAEQVDQIASAISKAISADSSINTTTLSQSELGEHFTVNVTVELVLNDSSRRDSGQDFLSFTVGGLQPDSNSSRMRSCDCQCLLGKHFIGFERHHTAQKSADTKTKGGHNSLHSSVGRTPKVAGEPGPVTESGSPANEIGGLA